MISIRTALTYGSAILLLSSGFAFAQGQASVGVFSVGIVLNRVATIPAGSCMTQTLFNQTGAVVRVTCVDNPFVNIAPSIGLQLPGTFGNTFRYPLYSNPSSFNIATVNVDSSRSALGSSNAAYRLSSLTANATEPSSPTSTVTDMSIYRTEPQEAVDAENLMGMVISF